jgi:hypothetical protein
MPVRTILNVSHCQYWIAELGAIEAISQHMYYEFNGLISAHELLAVVMTGTEFGPVGVTVDWRDSEPALELDSWDEVVDVSMVFEEEQAVVFGPNDRDGWELPALPVGNYRIRAHSRGRDLGHEWRTVEGEPVEEHLLMAWPAPMAPEIRHKLTDRYGAEIRQRVMPDDVRAAMFDEIRFEPQEPTSLDLPIPNEVSGGVGGIPAEWPGPAGTIDR